VLPPLGPTITNLSLAQLAPGISGAQLQPLPDGTSTATFFTEPGFVLDDEPNLARIAFGTQPNVSDLVRITPREIVGVDASGNQTLRGAANAGRIIVIGSQPVLEATKPDELMIYGRPGQLYILETSASLNPGAFWAPLGPYPVFNQSTRQQLVPVAGNRFVRLRVP
jgi:hypothetical protein